MTAEEFLTAVDPLPAHNFFYFSKSDHGLGHFSFSRAYINFLTFKDLEAFRDKFDGYVFVDSRGNEYPAVVEFAPFQKIPQMYWNPKWKEKRDKKCGTIEEDADYVSFLQSLEEVKNETLPSAETYLEEMEARDKEIRANRGCPKVVTPLMEYVLAKYSSKFKQRDDRRADDRKQRTDRTRDEKVKNKDPVIKKQKDRVSEKSGSSRKERRNEKRRRDRKEKQTAGPTDSNSQAPAPVKVLQKEKSHVKESPRPKPPQNVPASKSTTSSQSHPNKQSDQNAKVDRKPQTASNSSKSDALPTEVGANPEKAAKVRHRESVAVKKERIPNKERPAIPIYRPGSKRASEAVATKSESGKVQETSEKKSSDKRPENRNSERKANGGSQSSQGRGQKGPQSQSKSEGAASFRTKVFKSTRKPGGDSAA